MTRNTVLAIAFILLPALLSAQPIRSTTRHAVKHAEIRAITLQGDTITGKVYFGRRSELQHELAFYNPESTLENKGDAKRYKPFDIKGFWLEGQYFTSAKCKEASSAKQANYFLQQDITGQLSVYTLYEFHVASGDETKTRLVQLGKEVPCSLNDLRFFNFKQSMSSYLQDCPQLAKKISTREYIASDIDKIAQEYNSCSQ